MSQSSNGHTTNDGRPNIHPLQSGMGILTPPTSGSTSSYRFTSPPGTSTSGSSDKDQNEGQLADSDFQAKMESTVSRMEEKISRMETKICSLYNLNQQEKEGRKALQEKCRELEVAVRDREVEVATLKRQLEESEQYRERVIMQELGMRNMRHKTQDDIASLVHVAKERTENNHDLYERNGRHVQARTGLSQAFPPPMEQNTDSEPSMKQPPFRQQTAPNFIGGFAWKQ